MSPVDTLMTLDTPVASVVRIARRFRSFERPSTEDVSNGLKLTCRRYFLRMSFGPFYDPIGQHRLCAYINRDSKSR